LGQSLTAKATNLLKQKQALAYRPDPRQNFAATCLTPTGMSLSRQRGIAVRIGRTGIHATQKPKPCRSSAFRFELWKRVSSEAVCGGLSVGIPLPLAETMASE